MQEASPLDALVGWRHGTWGYHSDDGSILTGDETTTGGPVYGTGHTIGVAWHWEARKLLFSRDGERAGEFTNAIKVMTRPTVLTRG